MQIEKLILNGIGEFEVSMLRLFQSSSMVILLCLVLGTPPCLAAKQYRCFGKVQYRPCAADDAGSNSSLRAAPRLNSKSHPFDEIKGERFARVVTQDLSKLNRGDGLWKGTVHGNGLVELALRVFRGGNLESTRYMGSVWLRNKTTKFRFRATLPPGKNWRWEVVAWAS